MPVRADPLVSGQIYHIVNRGVASMPIFSDARDYQHFLESLLYYQNAQPPLRYSYFSRLPLEDRNKIIRQLNQNQQFCVELIAYCFMPNHIHLLLKQLVDSGISNLMMRFVNSYTRYFNTRNHRIGPIFQGRFKSVRIESEQQLLHVSRYIHLNPYSSGLVKRIAELKSYPYSSLPEYYGLVKNRVCQKEVILSYFKKPGSYKDFIAGQADYQRQLELLKHVLLENPETD